MIINFAIPDLKFCADRMERKNKGGFEYGIPYI